MSDDGDKTEFPPPTIFTTSSVDDLAVTVSRDELGEGSDTHELQLVYDGMIQRERHSWTTHLGLREKLGAGGQGVVYLTERRGADGFTLPVALKIFSPERYASQEAYELDMRRQAQVAAKVARIQHENLLVVENFLDLEGIRMMVMEWVEGFDLRRLLTPRMLGVIKERFSNKRWQHVNDTLITAGPEQPRFKTGVAIAIVRECLAALSAMHRHGLVHGDVKPGNIMLKSSGHVKLIDIGTAFDVDAPPSRRSCTPAYAAPEVLRGSANTPLSDLASLGYVVVELLSGRPLADQTDDLDTLVESKLSLGDRLESILPEDILNDDLLMSFCRGLIAPDPEFRFQTADSAILQKDGSSAILRQLIKTDMSMEYDNDIRLWIEELIDLRVSDQDQDGNA